MSAENTSSSKLSCNAGCFSWPSTMLSIAIIAIRAFQANAEPMSSWSALSWFLMLLPAFASMLVWLIIVALVFCGILAASKTGW